MSNERRSLSVVQLRELVDAFERDERDPFDAYFDKETLDVVLIPREGYDDGFPDAEQLAEQVEDAPERFLPVVPASSGGAYRTMERFAESLDDADARLDLVDALSGKGAFGRFRKRVAELGLFEAFNAFKARTIADEVRVWLEPHGIAVPDPPQKERPPAPEAQRPKATEVSLSEFLLLAIPDGKTEVLGGRVRRAASFATADLARGVFRSLARSICETTGLPWRKRFIEGTSTFERGPYHLALHASEVELWVDVAPQALAMLRG